MSLLKQEKSPLPFLKFTEICMFHLDYSWIISGQTIMEKYY